MSARVLVVDDVPTNVKILEAKLQASYYEVLKAYNGHECLAVAKAESPDLILLDVMMPEMDGFECCRRLKADPVTALIPVVMVTALDQVSDRVRGLEAGADDFLTKPPNDTALSARVRSLVRIKMMIDELRMRDETHRHFGLSDSDLLAATQDAPDGSVLIVEPQKERAKAIAVALSRRLKVNVRAVPSGGAALDMAKSAPPDLFIIASEIPGEDGMRLCSEVRSRRETKHSAIVMITEDRDFKTVGAALDLGVSDYLMRPVDEHELIARSKAQLRRKRYADNLKESLQNEMMAAVKDDLTGLYNRRYADQHIEKQLSRSRMNGAPLSVLLLDIDRFKSVNDTYGHAAGDLVLIAFAKRVSEELRGVDLVCRFGGEEFLVITPDADQEEASDIAERVRKAVARFSFDIGTDNPLAVTVSIGVAEWGGDPEKAASMIARADEALYASKNHGRNRVTIAAKPPG